MAQATLDTLIRLSEAEVDTARLELQEVLAEEERLRGLLTALGEEIEREQALVTERPDLSGDFGAFMVGARARREALEAEVQELIPRIEAARDALAEAFGNQKKYEIAKENRASQEDADEKRRDSLELDEQGLNQFRRK